MHNLTEILKTRKHRLWWQPLIGIVYVALCLVVLGQLNTGQNSILWAIGIGALSSSTFIVFATPHSAFAEPKRIFFGYFFATLIGWFIHSGLVWVYKLIVHNDHLFSNQHVFWVTAAITVGVSVITMVLLHIEHPPAVGMAIVLVLDVRSYETVVLILVLAAILALLSRVLRPLLDEIVIQDARISRETE